jgi:hypothetical protein
MRLDLFEVAERQGTVEVLVDAYDAVIGAITQ